MDSTDVKSPHFSGRLRGMRVTQDQFNRLLLSYRTSLTDHTAAARSAGVSYGTARKAFDKGITVDGNLREPIADTVARELRAAMTELDKMKTDQRSRTDMVASVERQLLEAQMANVEMVRGAMSNAMAGLAVTAHILNGAVGLAARVSRALDDPAYCPSPREAASLLRVLMHTGHFANESARIAQELQQAVAEATNIKKVAGGMTVEEAQQVIESTGRSAARLARAQARGQLPEAPKVFDVGQASPQEDILSDDGDEFEGDEESQDFDHVQSA